MRAPQAAGLPLNDERVIAWVEEFAQYRTPITRARILDWLGQFGEGDQDLAARVLDSVEFFGAAKIGDAFREALAGLPNWSLQEGKRKGKWRFAAMSQSAGESGDSMLHQFRIANGLTAKKYNEFFISPSLILKQQLGFDDSLVLLDDFVGSGQQVCTAWQSDFSEIVAGIGSIYLVVVAAYVTGRERIQAETDIRIVSGRELTIADNLFDGACLHFQNAEKERILRYCQRAMPSAPKGFGGCGLIIVFSHRCPNNSIPALHAARRKKWRPLFPR